MKYVFIILLIVAAVLLYLGFKQSSVFSSKLIQTNNDDIYFVNATWCKYCQKFMKVVEQYNATSTNKIKILDAAFMKQPKTELEKNIKKEIKGFPTIIVTNKNSSVVQKKRSGIMTLNQLKTFLN